MKVLVVGGGGREHALAWRFARDGHDVLAAPGNPGIADVGRCLALDISDNAAVVAAAVDEGVELVVVGPEAPLVAGLADALRARGIDAFGPGKDGAQLEGSKIYSKRFFKRHGIRTADFTECESLAEAERAIDRLGAEVVVKADGLAAGKGVVVCSEIQQAKDAARAMLEDGKFGEAGRRIIIERRLSGRELSLMAITDGKTYQVLEQAEDHKQAFDGDRGPNTGGMGTVSPAAWASDELVDRVRREIFDPTMRGLAADGIDYRGVLYAGVMVDGDGVPWMLEYNCRFGDPETQPVLARLQCDFAAWLAGAARGELPAEPLSWESRTAVCVVMAAEGYPASPKKGDAISGLSQLAGRDDVFVFHAGTRRDGEALVTSGGRVLGVTALGDGTEAAREVAYGAVKAIEFRGAHYRTDIGARERE